MDGNDNLSFKTGLTQKAREQAHDLLARAKAFGYWEEIASAFRDVLKKLATVPMTWGDPQYRTKLPGGWVYRGSAPPLYIRYAAFESQRAVVVYGVALAPYHPLAALAEE